MRATASVRQSDIRTGSSTAAWQMEYESWRWRTIGSYQASGCLGNRSVRLTNAAAGKLLDIDQPKVSALLAGF